MREFVIGGRQAGQRLDKYLGKVLDRAPKSFLYKMLRKKNIVLNGKKASGSEILKPADTVRIFFRDETFEKFSSGAERTEPEQGVVDAANPGVLYEDEHLLFLDKPAGILSQKARASDDSVNEWAVRYLLRTGSLKKEDLRDFRPSIGNRLDRNTSGIISVGKTVCGLQMLGDFFRGHTAKKYYKCLVAGVVRTPGTLDHYLIKDEKTNQVRILKTPSDQSSRISLEYLPLKSNGEYTLLEILLKTGRTHQIRAQLAAAGYPVLGDPKYGDLQKNRIWRKKTGLSRQLLHACRLELPDGRVIEAPLPEDFARVLDLLWKERQEPDVNMEFTRASRLHTGGNDQSDQ